MKVNRLIIISEKIESLANRFILSLGIKILLVSKEKFMFLV